MNASTIVGRRSSRAILMCSATVSRIASTSMPSARTPGTPMPSAFLEKSVTAEWRSTEVPMP